MKLMRTCANFLPADYQLFVRRKNHPNHNNCSHSKTSYKTSLKERGYPVTTGKTENNDFLSSSSSSDFLYAL